MISLLLTSMDRPSAFRVTLSFISVLKFAVAIGQVAGALTLVLFLLCLIVRVWLLVLQGSLLLLKMQFSCLEGTPYQVWTSGVHFLPCNVQYVYMSPSNDSMPLHFKDGCFDKLSLVSSLRTVWLG